MNADNMLYHPDFRAFERSFQMMTQVSAFRTFRKQRVIIQTYNPDHNTIQQVTNNDYTGCIRNSYMTGKFIKSYFQDYKNHLKHRDFDKLRKDLCGCIK
jgi:primosomal protein N' (replication factor Y)